MIDANTNPEEKDINNSEDQKPQDKLTEKDRQGEQTNTNEPSAEEISRKRGGGPFNTLYDSQS